MARGRTLVAILCLGAGTLAALVLGLRQHGPWQHPDAAPLTLVDPHVATLDTVRLRGRRVTASLSGTVRTVDEAGTTWLGDGAGTLPLVFSTPPGLEVEARVLIVGRLRGRDGRRWIEVERWAVVAAGAR